VSETPDPQVRYDAGGWISGPMMDPPLPPMMVPPGSTAQRELLRAIGDVLTLPAGENTLDDVRRLRVLDERAKLVTAMVGRILKDREFDDVDTMVAVRSLREAVADYPPDYTPRPQGM